MNPGLISALLESLIRILPKDIVKKSIDNLLDFVEDAISKSANKWDDAILPLIAALRVQIGVTEEAGSPYADKPAPAIEVNVNVNQQAEGEGSKQ